MNEERQNCVIDCRISSTKQATGGGLDDQQAVCLNHVRNNNWKVVRIFSKVYSGRSEERADFEEILHFIKESEQAGQPIHYYLVKSIDRITRDGVITFEEMKSRLEFLGVQLVDAYGMIQPAKNTLEHLGFEYKWSRKSPTATAQLVEAQRAKDEVTDILTRMVGAEIRLVQEGYKVRAPHDGFINQVTYVNGQKKIIESPDPARAPYFVQMFELRAAGGMSDAAIVKKINGQGYLTKTRKKWLYSSDGKRRKIGEIAGVPLTVKQLQQFISRTIYAGINVEKWTHGKPIKQQYDGLISIETFNRANRGKVYIHEDNDGTYRIIYNHRDLKTTAKRHKFNPLFQFDKLVLCPMGCGKPALSSQSTGKLGNKYPAYHCNRNHYWRVPKAQFESEVIKFLNNIHFDHEFLDGLEMVLLDKYREREAEVLKVSSKVSENIANLKAQQAEAVLDYRQTTNSIIKKKIEEEIEELERRIKTARVERQKVELQETDIKSFIGYVKYLMEHPVEMLADNSDPYRQKALWGLFFEETPTYDEIINGTPKLSPVIRLFCESSDEKSQFVNLPDLEWNTLASLVPKWNAVFNQYSLPEVATKKIENKLV